MQRRRFRCWLTPLLVLSAVLLTALPMTLNAFGQASADTDPAASAVSADQIAQPSAIQPHNKNVVYPRTARFWGPAGMPDYGMLGAENEQSTDALFFDAGSFLTNGPGLAFPSELRAPETPTGAAYYVIQFKPSAFEAETVQNSLQAIAATGVTIVEYVPQNGYIVKVTPQSYPALAASALLQYVAPYHPGYKISRGMGVTPLPDPDKAASPVYDIGLRGFPGVGLKDLEAQFVALGGKIIGSEETESGPMIAGQIDMSQILPLARIEGVRDIQENLPRYALGEEASWDVIAGTYQTTPAGSLPILPSLYKAGVDGSGLYKKDVDLAPLGVINPLSPPAAGTNDSDWNGDGILDNAAQIIAVLDTGMSVDAGDFSETSTSSGWYNNLTSCTVGQGGGTAGPNVGVWGGAMHRKIAWYEKAPTGFGNGDLCSCDPGPGHGLTTTAAAAGNASSGPFAADNLDWTGDGVPDSYGVAPTGDTNGSAFFFPYNSQRFRVDGVAKGAKILFQDVNSTCPEPATFSWTGLFGTLLSDSRGKGARIQSYSFGAYNNTATSYDSATSAIDTFLATDANRDFMVFVAAGNNGVATTNTNGYHKANTLSNEASAKDVVSVGGTLSGNAAALNVIYGNSSIGPAPNGSVCSSQTANGGAAPSNCGRIKPDLLAPATDGNLGLQEFYNCKSGDTNQATDSGIVCSQSAALSGTSFAAPSAAGAGALIRDYFAQGLYPDGTSANANNDADRKGKISGALVKALLIASTDMSYGGNNIKYLHRFNPDTGYGHINLSNVLPLANDPDTPSGLLVHDAGMPGTGAGVSNLSLPATLATSATAVVEFSLYKADEPLRCVLTWVETQGPQGILLNDLNLEMRYCGPDQNCSTTGGVCAYGLNNTTNGTACTSDATCVCGAQPSPPCQPGVCNMDKVWFGNVFSEDANDDGSEDYDLDGDGTAGLALPGAVGFWRSRGSWSLANVDANLDGTKQGTDAIAARDTRNNVEGIFLSNDPEGDGTGPDKIKDTQLYTGKWQLKLQHTAVGTDAQKYALVCAGGVTVDSSVRIDTNPLGCNGDLQVIVDEVPKPFSVDPGCCDTPGVGSCPAAPANCSTTTVSGRLNIKVATEGGTVVDQENGLPLTKDPNAYTFRTARLPVSTGIAGNPAGSPVPTDGILLAADKYTVTATYTDKVSGVDVPKSSTATYACTPLVQFFPIGQAGRDQKFLLAGGCDSDAYLDNGETFTYRVRFTNEEAALSLQDIVVTLRAVVPDGDNTTDPGRLNNTPSPYVSIPSPIVNISKVDAGNTVDAAFTVNVVGAPGWGGANDPPPTVEFVVGVQSQKAGKTYAFYQVFSHILNGDDEKFVFSTDYPTGTPAGVYRDIVTDGRSDLNNERIDHPIHDARNPYPVCPGGTRDCVDLLDEITYFSDMTTTSYGGGNPGFNGPWDFDNNDKGFRSGLYSESKGNGPDQGEWGEDYDYDGSLSGPYICQANVSQACVCPGNPTGGCDADTGSLCPQAQCYGGSNPGTNCTSGGGQCLGGGICPKKCMHTEDWNGNQNGVLDEHWSNTGACGWVSSNGASRGAWHTGTIGPAPAANCSGFGDANCQQFKTLPGSAGSNYWVEFLRSPIIYKVHKNVDSRGVDYKIQILDWRWNLNADYQTFLAGFTWEFDEDVDNLYPVDLGDGTILRNLNNGTGPISNGNVNLTRGFPMFTPTDPDDQNLLAAGFPEKNGYNTWAPNRNRTASRSCFFNALDSTQSSRLLRVPQPADDDCDNDIVSLGPDGCPGYCGVDDDEDGVVDNPEEACPCFSRLTATDTDADGRTDEGKQRQRFYRCSGGPSTGTANYCHITGLATDDCATLGFSGTCGHYGDGKPKPYGDDVCGDGSLDESVSAKFVNDVGAAENGMRLSQTQNWNMGVLNGPVLRFQTLEDVYDSEAGTKMQAAFGFIVFEGSASNPAVQSYGAAVDDVTVEWQESHPIQQAGAAGCGSGTCSGGTRPGLLCFDNTDCGAGGTCNGVTKQCTGGTNPGTSCTTSATCTGGGTCSQIAQAACAAVSWGQNTLYGGSGIVSLSVVDYNAETTQGTFDCTKYGFTTGCSGSCTASNDCNNNGLKEIEVQVYDSFEKSPETFRLEQTATHSPSYAGTVPFSSQVSSVGDGVLYLQYNGTANPKVTALYFDKNSGDADLNGDGTPDSPPSNGKDKCPGFCGVDDNQNATGIDLRPGYALTDDDGQGVCDFHSKNAGAPCVNNAGCIAAEVPPLPVSLATCLNVDEPDELCGRYCTAGTTSGICSANSSNANTTCTAPGTTSTCTGGGTCIAINCSKNSDCGTGGNCPGLCYNGSNAGAACTQLSDCTSGAVGGYCGPTKKCINGTNDGTACASDATCTGGGTCKAGLGDDDCTQIDEPGELCAIVATKLVAGIDDNCGCSRNPITADLNAFFNTADLIVQSWAFTDNGDNDGFADRNEKVNLTLTLRNLGTVDIDNVYARISSTNSNIACVNTPRASYGRINALQTATNAANSLQFTVANITRTALSQVQQGNLVVTITGTLLNTDGTRTLVEGTSAPQSITFDLNLNVSGSAPLAKTTKTFSFESTQYPDAASWESDWFHTAVPTHNGLHCQYNDPSGLLARAAPVGCFLRQDPSSAVDDDWHLHSTVSGGKQSDSGRDSGTPGICSGGKTSGGGCNQSADCYGGCTNGRCSGGTRANLACGATSDCTGGGTCVNTLNCAVTADCTGTCSNSPTGNPILCTASAPTCRFCNNDPTIKCTSSAQCTAVGGSCSAAGTCNFTGTCTLPAPGTCTGTGTACMHMGYHTGGNVQADTIHLDNIFYAYYKTPLQIGLGRPGTDDQPVLDWWQQVAVIDERAISNLSEPYSMDAAVAHILVDRNNDSTQEVGPPSNPLKDGFWEKVKPYYGAPHHQRVPAGNCSYDPDDDGNNEKDLDPSLLTIGGRATGPSSTCWPEFVWACQGDTQDSPYNPSLGQVEPNAICFPEVNAQEVPIVRQGAGPGRWVEAKVDLSKYRGRKIWFRFLTSHIQFGNGTWSLVLGGDYGGNRDDGWYIDDLQIQGTTPTSITLIPDANPTPPVTSCPTQFCGTPTALAANFTASTLQTLHDGFDNNCNGIADEDLEGGFGTGTCIGGTNNGVACTSNATCTGTMGAGQCGGVGSPFCDLVTSDGPLRNVTLNAQDNGTNCATDSRICATAGTCLNGVLQYRYWADLNNNNVLDSGELVRDWSENPTATAALTATAKIKLDVRCSSVPAACSSQDSINVPVSGIVGPSGTSLVGSDKSTLTWQPETWATGYDVAYFRYNGGGATFGGNFASFTQPQGGACPNGCNIATTTYNIGCKGNPAAGVVDFWVTRARGQAGAKATWNEGGNQLGSRDAANGSTPIPGTVCP